MSNQVLYRKWRPQRFGEVTGQDHICATLRNALKLDKVAHAYLFTGPRGVGKTSTARILAKALNCLNPVDGEPDNSCTKCIEVRDDKLLDLVEIDAASNRGIDDIRNLRQSVQYSPLVGGWKVYIVDEVHMLTEPAFNALLKTLEEPPPRIILILATTEAHRIPSTIISRCQRFDFRRIADEDVVSRLEFIAKQEDLRITTPALTLIANNTQGSLRDAISLLERASLAFPDREITDEAIKTFLGLAEGAAIKALEEAVMEQKPQTVVEVLAEQFRKGASAASLHGELLRLLRNRFVKTINAAGGRKSLSKLIAAITELEQADFRRSSDVELTLEIALLKAAFADETRPPATVVAPQEAGVPSRLAPTPEPAPTARARQPAPSPTTTSPPRPGPPDKKTEMWREVRSRMNTKPEYRLFANFLLNVEPPVVEKGVLNLRFRHESLKNKFSESTANQNLQRDFRQTLDEVYQPDLKIVVTYRGTGTPTAQVKDAAKSPDNYSPMVRHIMALEGKVVSEKPLGESS